MTSTDDSNERITWVRVMCDYSADPLWGRDGAMLGLEEVAMSPRLKGRMRDWADRFEELSARAVREPAAELAQEWTAFAMQGRHIAASLKEERRDITVVYFDQSRMTGSMDQERSEFEYEMTTEMADRLFSETDWPNEDYIIWRCLHCRSPFIGPKRQPHCMACEAAFVAPDASRRREQAERDAPRPAIAPPEDDRLVLVIVAPDIATRRSDLAHLAGRVTVGRHAGGDTGSARWILDLPDRQVPVDPMDLTGWAELHVGIKS
ncbi:hypothetical protein [Paracoccus sp. ME4]|uniref:hypothetical protein n=1 Tax=Paracoccus sp. ME4 TaxID=3138066 RepID=UPI00398B0320